MLRCNDLSLFGRGHVKTNPLVGSIITFGQQIIGEGYHQNYGGPHAEIQAIISVADSDKPCLSRSTIHVSLEPCCTTGKTPACTDAIHSEQFEKVEYGCVDPNPKVQGKGVNLLDSYGIKTEHIRIDRSERTIHPFFIQQTEERPYVILKFAQSRDGFIARENQRTAISNDLTKRLVHKWRSECDGILIGRKTAEIDNPLLTNRHYYGDSPVRIVLDPENSLPASSFLLSDETETWIINNSRNEHIGNKRRISFPKEDDLFNLLNHLWTLGIGTLLVEGGKETLQSFIDASLWDRAYIITNDKFLNGGTRSPNIKGKITSSYSLRDDHIVAISPIS